MELLGGISGEICTAAERRVGLNDEHVGRRQAQFHQGPRGIPLVPFDEGYRHVSPGTCNAHTHTSDPENPQFKSGIDHIVSLSAISSSA